MNLYEIDKKLKEALEKAVDPETGEILDDAAVEEFNNLSMAFDKKVDNILCFIKDLNADIKAGKEEENSLAKRRRSKEKKAEWLTGYVKNILNGRSFESPRAVVSYRKSSSVNITNMNLIPEEFLKYAEPTANKTAIKESIKEGKTVPGAEIVESTNMIIK